MRKLICTISKTKGVVFFIIATLLFANCNTNETPASFGPNEILIGLNGGTIEIPELNIQLNVPPGAVLEETLISFEKWNQINDSELLLMSEILVINPKNFIFQKPVTIKLFYDCSKLNESFTSDKNCPSIFHLPGFDSSDLYKKQSYAVLDELNNCCVNINESSVVGETTTLGAFAVVEKDFTELSTN